VVCLDARLLCKKKGINILEIELPSCRNGSSPDFSTAFIIFWNFVFKIHRAGLVVGFDGLKVI